MYLPLTKTAARALPAQVLALLMALSLGTPTSAQQAPKPEPPKATQPMAALPAVQTLRVLVLAGEGGQNDLQRGITSPLVVQVLDQNARPVEGAEVVFRFPPSGPTAEFAGQKPSRTVLTNGDGQAAATGWIASRQVGRFDVRVTALRGNEMGQATVSMENVPSIVPAQRKKGVLSSKWMRIGLFAGGAAAAGAAIAWRRRGGTEPLVVAVPGAPTIGGPR